MSMASAATATVPAWIGDLSFIAAVAMPEAWADEFGTTVNGMWADPDGWTAERVAAAHANRRRILVSVPLMALTHQVYERAETAYLMDEVCRDIDGGLAEVGWYYWDAKPVYSLCIHSPKVRTYLVDRLRGPMAAGVDVVNVDEIQTSVGLMNRQPKGSGFCHRCLASSAVIREAATARQMAEPTDDEARGWLRDGPELYDAFVTEQQERAFSATKSLFEELREIARRDGQPVAITANVTGLGSYAGSNGELWTAAWGELLDMIMLEAIYQVPQSEAEDPHAHRLLPRGTFAPLYRLGHAIGARQPIWITPQINVPRQLAGQRRQRYYELMFLEAYANRGRWGYYWWPGADAQARREATAPDTLKTWTAFMRAHRDRYVDLETANDVAVVYSNAAVLEQPETHYRYLALAQALYEANVQYDVIYTGDTRFAAADLHQAELARYGQLIVPGFDLLTQSQAQTIESYRARGGRVSGVSSDSVEARLLDRFWITYGDADRAAIVEACAVDAAARIHVSAPRVVATRYASGRDTVIHLLDYDYRPETDEVVPVSDLVVRVAWTGALPAARLVSPTGDTPLAARLDGPWLELTVPLLRDHAVVEIIG
jgi:hypothetical protein